MKNRKRRWLFIAIFLAISGFVILNIQSKDGVTYDVQSKALCPPDFEYSKLKEKELDDKHQSLHVIIYLPKKYFNQSNLNRLFICSAEANAKYDSLLITVFNDKERAGYDSPISLLDILGIHVYDAMYLRDKNRTDPRHSYINEKYEYRPYRWIPFYYKKVLIKRRMEETLK